MGIFLDGYELFILAIALPLIMQDFKIGPVMTGIVGAASIIGMIFGAIIGGRLSDRLGRKTFFMIDLVFFIFFAILSGFAQDVYSLILFRFFVGVGIGADYPICASYVTEFMPADKRGRMLIGSMSFQAIGMFVAAGIGLLILYFYPSIGSWRIMLIAGVSIAFVILLIRKKVPESARWYMDRGMIKKAAAVVATIVPSKKDDIFKLTLEDIKVTERKPMHSSYLALFSPKYINRTILSSVPWFLMDIATYGVGMFTPIILGLIAFSGEGLDPIAEDFITTEGVALLDIFLVLGFFLNILLVDRVGRIKLQVIGFIGMIAGLLILSYTAINPGMLLLTFVGFIIFNVLMNAGPNATTFILAAELFPTNVRASGHGFSTSMAKLGAAIGIFMLPIMKSSWGIPTTLIVIAAGCVIGLIITILFRIETTGKALEELNK